MTGQFNRYPWWISENGLPWVAGLFGVLLAIWVIVQAHGAINSDGLVYIEAARLFSAGHWSQSLKIHEWPFYSILLMVMQKVSGLSFQSSAHALSIIGFALTCSGLTILVREAGGDRRTMLASMLLISTSTYMVGTVLPMVIRDQLFWAAYVWSVISFTRFYRGRAWRTALAWGITGGIAVLFRIEALTFLLLLPLVLLTDTYPSWKKRCIDMSKAYWIVLSALFVMMFVFVFVPSVHWRYLVFSHDHSPVFVAQQVYDQFAIGLSQKSRVFADQILGSYLNDYALSGILLTLGYILAFKTISSAGWLQLGVLAIARSARGLCPRLESNKIFFWLLFLGTINAAFILLANFLLPKRYLMPIAFVILVYASFGLHALYDAWRLPIRIKKTNTWLFPILIFLFVVQFFVISWPSDYKKLPSLQAANWISSHVSKESRIYYDSSRIRYYVTGDSSKRTEDDWGVVQQSLSQKTMSQYDYAVVRVPRKNPERRDYLTKSLGTEPIAAFDSPRGDWVLIYRVSRK